MLKSLKNLDTKTAQRILSDLTTALLPNPRVGTESGKLGFDSAIYEGVREEIHRLLRIDPSDLSPMSRAKVFQFLARQMSDIALADANINSIKKRIGQRGELRPDLYEIKFLKTFEMSEDIGIRRNHVSEVIRQPDSQYQLPMKHVPPEEYGTFSLLLRQHSGRNYRDSFALLVLTRRFGYTHDVVIAYRVYHSEVGFSDAQSPLNILLAFLEIYGVDLGSRHSKLVFDEVLDISTFDSLKESWEPNTPDSTSVMPTLICRRSRLSKVAVIALSMLVNWEKYAVDLRKHGVEIVDRETDADRLILDLDIASDWQ
jgi:hypothetical protein